MLLPEKIKVPVYLFSYLVVALGLRFVFVGLLSEEHTGTERLVVALLALLIGGGYVLRGVAKIIEETTEVLSKRTKLASGLLQSFGTAFPDMVLGIVAAITSLGLAATDYGRAVNYAVIAAATTFGSNIYNIGHATWCVWRQNLANKIDQNVAMFPILKNFGTLKPMRHHENKPSLKEVDTAISVTVVLTLLTFTVVVGMVLFGKITTPPEGFSGDLYQLIRPIGIVILLLGAYTMYRFRNTQRSEDDSADVVREERFFTHKSNLYIWICLIVSGIAILFAAESMVRSIEAVSEITHLPFVIAGVLAGLIGCLGEIIVVHNYSVHPKGRIGDAVVGVAMDNIVTTMGAAIVAIMGGIFLGGNALILVFVIIFTLNTLLVGQLSTLKNYFISVK